MKNNSCFTGSYFISQCNSFCEEFAFFFEGKNFSNLFFFFAVYSFRSCLYDVQLPVQSIFCPFYIHCFAIVLFYFVTPLCKPDNFIFCKRKLFLFLRSRVNIYNCFFSRCTFCIFNIQHCKLFSAAMTFQNRV